MQDDECIHGLDLATCSLCRMSTAASSSRFETPIWEKYRDRYKERPETFEAYVDVWQRLTGARSFPGGWTLFSRTANAEPAVDAALVRRAEDLMELGRYRLGLSTRHGGRRWRRARN